MKKNLELKANVDVSTAKRQLNQLLGSGATGIQQQATSFGFGRRVGMGINMLGGGGGTIGIAIGTWVAATAALKSFEGALQRAADACVDAAQSFFKSSGRFQDDYDKYKIDKHAAGSSDINEARKYEQMAKQQYAAYESKAEGVSKKLSLARSFFSEDELDFIKKNSDQLKNQNFLKETYNNVAGRQGLIRTAAAKIGWADNAENRFERPGAITDLRMKILAFNKSGGNFDRLIKQMSAADKAKDLAKTYEGAAKTIQQNFIKKETAAQINSFRSNVGRLVGSEGLDDLSRKGLYTSDFARAAGTMSPEVKALEQQTDILRDIKSNIERMAGQNDNGGLI